MDNNNDKSIDSLFSSADEKNCFIDIKKDLIKLLRLIEAEQRGEGNAEFFLYGFLFDLASSNRLCGNKLTKIIVKIHGLVDNNYQYRQMSHQQIKNQIMESRGILDYLIGEKPHKHK